MEAAWQMEYPSAHEARFDDEFVGTLDHARTNRPNLMLELRVLHQELPFPQIAQGFADPFQFSKRRRESIGHAQEGTRLSMLEYMPATAQASERGTVSPPSLMLRASS